MASFEVADFHTRTDCRQCWVLLQRLLNALSPLRWNYELVNKSWPIREQGLGVARLRVMQGNERGRDGWGQPGQAGERPRAEHLAFIVHLLYALHAPSIHQHVYLLCAGQPGEGCHSEVE